MISILKWARCKGSSLSLYNAFAPRLFIFFFVVCDRATFCTFIDEELATCASAPFLLSFVGIASLIGHSVKLRSFRSRSGPKKYRMKSTRSTLFALGTEKTFALAMMSCWKRPHLNHSPLRQRNLPNRPPFSNPLMTTPILSKADNVSFASSSMDVTRLSKSVKDSMMSP